MVGRVVIVEGERCAIKRAPRPNRAYRGLPESSHQRANICDIIPMPRHSRSGEMRGGATKAYIEMANYLRKIKKCLLCSSVSYALAASVVRPKRPSKLVL